MCLLHLELFRLDIELANDHKLTLSYRGAAEAPVDDIISHDTVTVAVQPDKRKRSVRRIPGNQVVVGAACVVT